MKTKIFCIWKDEVTQDNRPSGNVMIQTNNSDDIAWAIPNIIGCRDLLYTSINVYEGDKNNVYVKIGEGMTQDKAIEITKLHLKHYCDWSEYEDVA